MARAISSGNYLTTASAPVTAVPLTIACWFNPTAINTNGLLVSIDNGGTSDRFCILKSSAAAIIAQAVGAGNAANATTTTNYTAGAWQHACGTFSATNARAAYLGGGGKGTNATLRVPSGLTTTAIGALSGGTVVLAGSVAEATIWNIALSDAQVADLAKGFDPRFIRPDAIVAHWSLMGRSSPEPDFIGGFDMALTGTPGQASHPRIIPLRQSRLLLPEAGDAPPAEVAAKFIAQLCNVSTLMNRR